MYLWVHHKIFVAQSYGGGCRKLAKWCVWYLSEVVPHPFEFCEWNSSDIGSRAIRDICCLFMHHWR